MPIELNCPGCGKQLRLADEHAGKAGRCPACQATFQIPTHSQQQTPAPPFGSGAPQPFAPATPPAGAPAPGSPFPQQSQQPPNPFASTSNMQSPYGGTNPYASPQAPMYGGPPSTSGEGNAVASMILGIVSIVFAFVQCCCLNLLVGVPCGIIGLVLAYQVPPDQRKLGMILNIVGLGLNLLITIGWWGFNFWMAFNNAQFNQQFNP